MTIQLTPEIENALTKAAQRQGTTPELLALDCLRQGFLSASAAKPPAEEPGTLAEFLTGYMGVLHSSKLAPGGAQMSDDGSAKFAAGLIKKRAQGRL